MALQGPVRCETSRLSPVVSAVELFLLIGPLLVKAAE